MNSWVMTRPPTTRIEPVPPGPCPVTQEQLLPFLLNPRSYPHRPRRVHLVQTHASFVFIAAPFVYKIKKQVNFGFLDFSTLEKRRHFCEREVTLNRRLSPRIYLGVVPICRAGNGFAFGGSGEVMEYAVKMRRLSAGHFLDQLVERDAIVPGDLNRIATALKQFYQAQHPTAEVEAWGRIDRLRISTDENFRQTRPFLGCTISRAAFQTIHSYTNRFYTQHRRLFASRIKEQRIRDCHGDLHLEHIHLTPRALHIYDCIEFNDRFRYVDVANDAAFLAMDLDYEGRADLSRYFSTQMASALNDPDLLKLMNFYKCYRAFVRGKVESLHSVTQAAPEAERQAGAERARRYFRLALNYAVAGSQPLLLVVMGRIASGKTTLARALGAELGWEVYSSDYVRKQMAGFPLYERTRRAARQRLYSETMTAQTYHHLLASAAGQLQRGRSVILDATFARRAHRDLLIKRFGKAGVAWRILEVQASDLTVRRRLRRRETNAAEISDARLDDFDVLTHRYQVPREVPVAHLARIRNGGSIDLTLRSALENLARLSTLAGPSGRGRASVS
ncbi:MAG TPA: AAA family ATPase [Verrucomicrobiae bacterium]|nr:AAA family ATPase [Verrucomicrobiae bacterium]